MLRELNDNEMMMVSGGTDDSLEPPTSITEFAPQGIGLFGDIGSFISGLVDAVTWWDNSNEPAENTGYDISEFSPTGQFGVLVKDNNNGTKTYLIDHDGNGSIDYAAIQGNGIYATDTNLDGNVDNFWVIPGL
ncbi:MAG: hypothetical protein COA43_15650 [Robiginitomaculum sp.]|nr:MAG: hypothetical protein COA43_15650 [Robiginitomaculum sp.]